MIKYYCDRCKKQIKSADTEANFDRFYNLNNERPEIGTHRGEVHKVIKDKWYSDNKNRDDSSDTSEGYTPYYYSRQCLCANCQKELDLLVTEYMGR